MSKPQSKEVANSFQGRQVYEALQELQRKKCECIIRSGRALHQAKPGRTDGHYRTGLQAMRIHQELSLRRSEDSGMSEECDLKADIRCRRCHRALKNPDSRAKGYGPICNAKEAKERLEAQELAEAAT